MAPQLLCACLLEIYLQYPVRWALRDNTQHSHEGTAKKEKEESHGKTKEQRQIKPECLSGKACAISQFESDMYMSV
jgi:hypothetical protein